jgi:glycosyltransferase involved in cell wall biosynthesis
MVSVVVPTRNSERTIEACLSSVRAQTYRPIELIVVDNNSADATAAIASRLSDSVLTAGPERCAQRNVGARVARGSHLLFVDSDMVLEPQVVLECVELADAGADAVVIPERSFGEGFWARCKMLERSCYVGDEAIEAARFFSRALFETVGGYDEDLTAAEDWDLHERVRRGARRIARTRAFIHHDEGHLRLGQLLAKKFRYGTTIDAYLAKHPGLARRQLRLFRPAFGRHGRRLVRQPVVAAGMVVMKTAEVAAGATGLLMVRVLRVARSPIPRQDRSQA